MKRFTIYIITPLVLALIFWAAVNQRKGAITIRGIITPVDSSRTILISVHEGSREVAYMKEDSTWVIIDAEAAIKVLLKVNDMARKEKDAEIERLRQIIILKIKRLEDLIEEVEKEDRGKRQGNS